MMDDDEIDDVLAAPGATLAEGRGPVRRVRLANGDSVIVKQRDLGVWSATNLATERAALDRLADTSPAIGPRLLGARSGVLVLEDLGERTVERVLHADEPSAAEAALVALAEVTARLHATADLTLIVGGERRGQSVNTRCAGTR